MRIDETAELLMLHIVSQKTGLTEELTRYRMQAAEARRPESGHRRGAMVCATCGDAVPLRVHSADGTRRRKRRWVVVTVIGALIMIAGVLAITVYGDTYDSVPVVGGLSLAAAWLTVYVGAVSIVRENGVVIAARRRFDPHSVRPLYVTGGWRRRDREIAVPTTFTYDD